MPSLSDQLKALGVQIGTSNLPKPSKSKLDRKLEDVLHGAWEETRRGDCFVVRKFIPYSQTHGTVPLANIPDLSLLSTIPSLTGIENLPKEDLLFIDTETTGLSGGAGTYVFLIGVAKYAENGIDFAQFFLQDPAAESSQLAALEDFVTSSKLIVSYNGKSFDLPRIKTRFSYSGSQSPFDGMLHIDLLHIARRIWKRHLPGCTLGDLEHHILELERSSLDIPGWQVSEKFFDYLQSGDPDPLKSVFYHNELDVISLISLLSYVADRITNPDSSKYHQRQDQISVGEYLIHLKQADLAQTILDQALTNNDLPDELRINGLLNLANLHKKSEAFNLAIPLWKECAALRDPRPNIELAKYYEHKKADFQEAIHWTLSAKEIYHKTRSEPFAANLISEAEYRLARLKRKMTQQDE